MPLYPVLFSIAGVPVYSWGLFFALGFLAATLFVLRRAGSADIPGPAVLDLGVLVLLGAVAGARLLFVLLNWHRYLPDPAAIFGLREGGISGLSFHGGLVGGFLAGWLYARRRRLPVGVLANMAAPALALGYAITKVGCFLSGDDYGTLTVVPWAVTTWMAPGLRHPVQLYDAALNLLLFAGLWHRLRRPLLPPWSVFALYLAGYSLIRFTTEFFRDGPRLWGTWLTLAQLVSLVGMAAGTAAWLHLDRRRGAAAGEVGA